MTVKVCFRLFPGSLSELHAAESEPPRGLQRLRRHSDHVGSVAEGLERSRSHLDPRLLIVRRIPPNEPGLDATKNNSRRLLEALARLAEFDAKRIEFAFRETAAESNNHPSAGQMIQKDRLLGHTERIVPWQDEGTGHELDLRRAPRDIAQEGDVVRNHRVIKEVVFDRH